MSNNPAKTITIYVIPGDRSGYMAPSSDVSQRNERVLGKCHFSTISIY